MGRVLFALTAPLVFAAAAAAAGGPIGACCLECSPDLFTCFEVSAADCVAANIRATSRRKSCRDVADGLWIRIATWFPVIPDLPM